MKLTYYESTTRGLTATGWLVGKHMFSFGQYVNVQRMRFGSLRVFNDDLIMPGTGFGPHGHDNMEIITVILQGSLRHEDSMGHSAVITAGEVQTMSAGTGVIHSEMNASQTEALKLLQIWIDTEQQDIKPAYDQKTIGALPPHTWTMVAGPKTKGRKHALINAQSWVYLADFEADAKAAYSLKDPKNGLFLFMIDGQARLDAQELYKGDGLGVQQAANIELTIKQPSKILLIEMPMRV